MSYHAMFSVLGILLFLFVEKVNTEQCKTSDGIQGECVFIDNCPELLTEFKYPLNETEEPLSRFICRDKFDYVCCSSPKNSTYGRELSDRRFCGYQHTDDYFSETNSTSIDEFPWVAAIMATYPGATKEVVACHGGIINKRYVLTVAQCFSEEISDVYNITRVILGEYHMETETDCVHLPQFSTTDCSNTDTFEVEETIIHPFYNEGKGINDIALLRLNRKVFFTDYVRPICLPIQGIKLAEIGQSLYTTGWGRVTNEGGTALIKKKIETVLVTQEECQRAYQAEIFSINHICTLDVQNNTEYSCIGDAGAPVMFQNKNQWHLEGLVSRATVCGEVYPGIQMRITSYLEWIKQNIRK